MSPPKKTTFGPVGSSSSSGGGGIQGFTTRLTRNPEAPARPKYAPSTGRQGYDPTSFTPYSPLSPYSSRSSAISSSSQQGNDSKWNILGDNLMRNLPAARTMAAKQISRDYQAANLARELANQYAEGQFAQQVAGYQMQYDEQLASAQLDWNALNAQMRSIDANAEAEIAKANLRQRAAQGDRAAAQRLWEIEQNRYLNKLAIKQTAAAALQRKYALYDASTADVKDLTKRGIQDIAARKDSLSVELADKKRIQAEEQLAGYGGGWQSFGGRENVKSWERQFRNTNTQLNNEKVKLVRDRDAAIRQIKEDRRTTQDDQKIAMFDIALLNNERQVAELNFWKAMQDANIAEQMGRIDAAAAAKQRAIAKDKWNRDQQSIDQRKYAAGQNLMTAIAGATQEKNANRAAYLSTYGGGAYANAGKTKPGGGGTTLSGSKQAGVANPVRIPGSGVGVGGNARQSTANPTPPNFSQSLRQIAQLQNQYGRPLTKKEQDFIIWANATRGRQQAQAPVQRPQAGVPNPVRIPGSGGGLQGNSRPTGRPDPYKDLFAKAGQPGNPFTPNLQRRPEWANANPLGINPNEWNKVVMTANYRGQGNPQAAFLHALQLIQWYKAVQGQQGANSFSRIPV